jgi:hypothetical protein
MALPFPIAPVTAPQARPLAPGLDQAAAGIFGGAAPAPQLPPDPYTNRALLLKTFKDFKEECFDQRNTFEAAWWRNVLYYLSRQWIYYDAQRNKWLDKRLHRWVPKPVTNKVRETTDAILSVFRSVQLTAICKPDGANPVDIQTSEIATRLGPPIHVEHNMGSALELHDWWLALTGNAILQVWWDSKGQIGNVLVPLERCQACGKVSTPRELVDAGSVCPACGAASLTLTGDTQAIDHGSGRTTVLSPFEVAVPLWCTDLDTSPGLIIRRWRPKSWMLRFHPELAKTLSFERLSTDRSLQLLRTINAQTDLASLTERTAGVQPSQEGVTEYEMWLKPTADFGRGLVLRVLGERDEPTIFDVPGESLPGPLPHRTRKGDPLFPFVHTRYARVGGRFWGQGPVDLIVQKQDALNQLDSMLLMMVQRTSNSVWLMPKGSEVSRLSGEPGLKVTYIPSLTAGGAKPERLPGDSIPPSLMKLREQYLADIESLVGTFDVTKGQKPAGIEAFSAMQLLVERSQSRFGPMLKQRGEAYAKWFLLALELERQYGPVERTWAVLGPNGSWGFEKFQNADLQGAIRVAIEDGSEAPKTNLGKRAAIEQLRQIGVINPQNPDTAYRILQVFGQTDLWPGLDAYVQSALEEQDAFEKWAVAAEMLPPDPMAPYQLDPMTGQPAVGPDGQAQLAYGLSDPNVPGRRMPWHVDEVHVEEHRKWANGDTVRELVKAKPWLEPYIGWMLQQHEEMIQFAAQQQAAMQAQATAKPGGRDGKGVGGGRAMAQSNAESGNPADVPTGVRQTGQRQGPQ